MLKLSSSISRIAFLLFFQYSSLVLKDENLSYMLFMFYNDKTDISSKILEELNSAAEGFKDKVPYTYNTSDFKLNLLLHPFTVPSIYIIVNFYAA